MINSRTKPSLPMIDKFINGIRNHKLINLAKSTGFIKRSDGKLEPSTFIKALTFKMLGVNDPTLQVIADACENIQNGLSISREAIHQRLEGGARLMEEVLKNLLQSTFSRAIKPFDVKLLKQFNDVLLCDSTVITLSKRLGKLYPGASGENKGSVKLQTIYSFAKKCFKKVDIFWGMYSDFSYTPELAKSIHPGDLVMFDLGYGNKIGFNDIANKGGFFLSRARSNFVYYILDNKARYSREKLNMVEILKKSNGTVDMELLVGYDPERQIKCRFIAMRLPDDVANERIRKAYIRRRKKVLPVKEIELLKWNTFITNASIEQLPLESVSDLYKIRWQIEIMYKACKGHLGLDNLGIGGKAQVQCILYGRLITTILMTAIYSNCYLYVNQKHQRELSIQKFFNYVKHRTFELNHLINSSLASANRFAMFFTKAADASLYEKRKRKSSLQNLQQYTLSG